MKHSRTEQAPREYQVHVAAFDDLRGPLAELGQRWAESPYRPRPTADALSRWDAILEAWLRTDLPLVLRDARHREESNRCSNGRQVIFADNSPANWVFGLALAGEVPDLSSWTSEGIGSCVPLSFLTKGPAARRDLNRAGWKVCHIDPVSDRKRYKVANASFDQIEAEFRRFLSPRNIFLIPKSIAGAGELPEVVAAVREYELLRSVPLNGAHAPT